MVANVQGGLRRSAWQDARSERASAASDASGALRRAYSAQGSSRYFKACIQCARQVMNFKSIRLYSKVSYDPGTLPAHLEYPSLHCIREIVFFFRRQLSFYACIHSSSLNALPVRLLRHVFFSVFSLRFPLFLAREGFQVEVYVGPMLELVLGGVLEASWKDLGKVLGGQDSPKTSQDCPKTGQVGVKTG